MSSKYHNKLCDFSGDPDQYCYETLYFCDFSGGSPDPLPPPPPLDPRMFQITNFKRLSAQRMNMLVSTHLFSRIKQIGVQSSQKYEYCILHKIIEGPMLLIISLMHFV